MTAMGGNNHQLAARTRVLTQELVDGCIQNAEWADLQALVSNSSECRQAYIEVIQLSTDLYYLSRGFSEE